MNTFDDELTVVAKHFGCNLGAGEVEKEFTIPAKTPRPAYNTFDISKAAAAYQLDCAGEELAVVKVKTHRWLLCKEDGTVVASKRFEHEILGQAAKIEERRIKGNLHGFRFGKKVDSGMVVQYAKLVWGERFQYSNVEYDGHYWWGDVKDAKTGKVAAHLRMDYHINYERQPDFAVRAH
jgi:hypothetical protein